MNNTELFLDRYKHLEDAIHRKYGKGSVSRLEDMGEFRHLSSKIKYVRELRNLLSHNAKIEGEWGVEVNDTVISFVDELIIKIKKPQRAASLAIPVKECLYATLSSNVYDVMWKMRERDISKVPVLDRGCVVGVFSYKSVFLRAMESGSCTLDADTKFRDIMHEISIEGEEGLRYPFVKSTELRSTVEKIIDDANERHIRVKLVFLTPSGDKGDKLVGILSPWELIEPRE